MRLKRTQHYPNCCPCRSYLNCWTLAPNSKLTDTNDGTWLSAFPLRLRISNEYTRAKPCVAGSRGRFVFGLRRTTRENERPDVFAGIGAVVGERCLVREGEGYLKLVNRLEPRCWTFYASTVQNTDSMVKMRTEKKWRSRRVVQVNHKTAESLPRMYIRILRNPHVQEETPSSRMWTRQSGE